MAAENQAVISWNANTEPDLAGYRVYYGLFPGVYTGNSGLIQTLSYQFTPSSSDGLWHFAVSAVDTSNNESGLSSVVSKRLIQTTGRIVVRK